MRCLIFVEHSDGTVSESALELGAMAKSIGAEAVGLICAADPGAVNALAGQLGSFDAVIGVADDSLATYNPDAAARALTAATEAHKPDLVMTSYSAAGVDLAPNVAIRTGRQMVGYVSGLELDGDTLNAMSTVYSGKLVARTGMDLPGIVAVMPGAVKADGLSGGAPAVEMMDVDLSGLRMRVTETLVPENTGVNLADAEKIFCVGRALGGTEKIELAENVAAALGAELAGSRPVIDAGWMPKVRQVGKSGTKVKPRLYLMAGVSGAPEHLEGMANSELIIAINSDEQAPIFGTAHYGAVCDMFELMPALTERLTAGK
ncbi:electron transfer flavoprotein alpha subunit apoprotein [Rhodovulum imhoffii]|uniref:Electron transfer flavoprotein alpha subunit apoprotein n=1 Tax=Rhodovulum imhoffii TaxID=365340 RepID=A0A2T5BNQ2_9RHOB|nr:electron transfer flavoprotein subunit alpha/FixB family protein [Rhodovulum imhoffii]MBK5933616.1 hypothetical protein [Rhodovulum imhoffii]PTN00616.1 electron transfer flavoprotein alpha subunit apoprotein [Rhodovulum imhoffii]